MGVSSPGDAHKLQVRRWARAGGQHARVAGCGRRIPERCPKGENLCLLSSHCCDKRLTGASFFGLHDGICFASRPQGPSRLSRSLTDEREKALEKGVFLLLAAFLLAVKNGGEPAKAQQSSSKVTIINTERQEVGEASITDTPNGVLIGLSLREKPSGISPGPTLSTSMPSASASLPSNQRVIIITRKKNHTGFSPKVVVMPATWRISTCPRMADS
jgi:hypothetical protein